MENLWQNLKNWQKIGIAGGVLAIIVIIVVAIINISSSGPNVKINFEGSVNIPGDEIKKIRENLVGVIENNTKDFSDKVVYVGNARDYKESVSDKISEASFIVDFDEIKESYAIVVTWPSAKNDDSPNIIIACPLLDSKYPETPCETEYNNSTDIVSYLPYEGADASGDKYKIKGKYSSGKLYLEITADKDPGEALIAAKKWIKSIGLNPEDYLYYVSAKQYIQANNANTKDVNVNKNLPYFVPAKYYVYPVIDENSSKVVSIRAELGACTEAQTEPAEKLVRDYLNSHGIDYPVEFEYCAN